MIYTVKNLSKISGVSIRTLHWYDKINLLKPKAKDVNKYRYYDEKQLLSLQQILFFKELGFSLNDIRKLLSQNDFDNVKALYKHKKILEKDIDRKNTLIATIDKTIQYLRGKLLVKEEELYYGFDRSRQKEYEQYLVQYQGIDVENLLLESKKATAKWDKDEWDDVKNQGDDIHKALAEAIEQGIKPDSDAVQAIIHRHCQLQGRFHDITKNMYIGLSELYAHHPDFRKFFDVYHPNMIEFIGEGMRFYANKNLSI